MGNNNQPNKMTESILLARFPNNIQPSDGDRNDQLSQSISDIQPSGDSMDEQGEAVNGTQPVEVAHIHPLGILNSTQPIGETGNSNRRDGEIDEVTFNTGH